MVRGDAVESAVQRERSPRRALVVGAGHRVQNAFLPALHCLGSEVEVVGIHSRTFAGAQRVGARWGVPAIEELSALRPGEVDVVLVSVTTVNNLAVLHNLAHLAPDAALVIDTPVLGRLRDLTDLAEYRKWAQIRVAEDFMNMPQYRLVGQLIAGGAVGEVSHIRLAEMGYRYHALALVRSWLDFARPVAARSRRLRRQGVDITYRFPGGAVAEVIEPYRQAAGLFIVAGTEATVVGHPMGHPIAPADIENLSQATPPRAVITLERGTGQDGQLAFVAPPQTAMAAVSSLDRLRNLELAESSEFNLLRIDGLVAIIRSLWHPDPVNTRYRVYDAMADLLVSSSARRYPWLPIPRRGELDIVDLADRAMTRRTSGAA